MNNWLRQHRFAMMDALARAFRKPGSFLFNALVIAAALALPFAGIVLLENIRPVSQQIAVEPEISVFLGVDTPRERASALAPAIQRILQKHSAPAKIEFVPRENALKTLKNNSGMADAVTTLGTNPLPDAYILRLAAFQNSGEAACVDLIAVELKALPGVEYVQVDSAWVKRLAALVHIFQLALLSLAVLLGTVVIAVIFNTIRLQVLTQTEEIEVTRLFGATDAYMYRPFYYSGALLGLSAGVLALGFVWLGLRPLNQAVSEFARLYASEFFLASPSLALATLMLAVAGILGWSGAALSVRQHLK